MRYYHHVSETYEVPRACVHDDTNLSRVSYKVAHALNPKPRLESLSLVVTVKCHLKMSLCEHRPGA